MVFVEKWLTDDDRRDAKGMTLVAADRIATIFTKRFDGQGYVVCCSLSDSPLRDNERHMKFNLSPMIPDPDIADLAACELVKAVAAAQPGDIVYWDGAANRWSTER